MQRKESELAGISPCLLLLATGQGQGCVCSCCHLLEHGSTAACRGWHCGLAHTFPPSQERR